jgi:hypothetical protein
MWPLILLILAIALFISPVWGIVVAVALLVAILGAHVSRG